MRESFSAVAARRLATCARRSEGSHPQLEAWDRGPVAYDNTARWRTDGSCQTIPEPTATPTHQNQPCRPDKTPPHLKGLVYGMASCMLCHY